MADAAQPGKLLRVDKCLLYEEPSEYADSEQARAPVRSSTPT